MAWLPSRLTFFDMPNIVSVRPFKQTVLQNGEFLLNVAINIQRNCNCRVYDNDCGNFNNKSAWKECRIWILAIVSYKRTWLYVTVPSYYLLVAAQTWPNIHQTEICSCHVYDNEYIQEIDMLSAEYSIHIVVSNITILTL